MHQIQNFCFRITYGRVVQQLLFSLTCWMCMRALDHKTDLNSIIVSLLHFIICARCLYLYRLYLNKETEKYIRFVKINLFCKKIYQFCKQKTLDLYCMTFKKILQSEITENTTSMHACICNYPWVFCLFFRFLHQFLTKEKERTFLRNVQRWHLQYKQQMKRQSNSMSKQFTKHNI